MNVSTERQLLKHFLAAIAYRSQKAIRNAPAEYWTFDAGKGTRSPIEIYRHMTSLMGYVRTFFLGGSYPFHPEPLPTIDAEMERFHTLLNEVGALLESGGPLNGINERQLLQGPFADIMTHVGQLAILRRLHGSPVPPENFIYADISPDNLTKDQSEPRMPDKGWTDNSNG